ncbi:hypothetical protein KK137_10395 [Croceibacterium sp. LX-88]|uniref:Uncharacterized protein n=1 Tax=Croceibacterium selenioxidans TaxID=2838833 RepID=A0ABS5W4W1_9SPHN|nr:hypothetical protein [Croceibacterium selenioxidans]MBT2134744.1 hypothetical protein [Croceibacterium selenioxidans]
MQNKYSSKSDPEVKNYDIEPLTKCLLSILYCLESSDDSQINPDFALEMMEGIIKEIREMGGEFVKEFLSSVKKQQVNEGDPLRRKFSEGFAEDFGFDALI